MSKEGDSRFTNIGCDCENTKCVAIVFLLTTVVEGGSRFANAVAIVGVRMHGAIGFWKKR